MNLPFLALWVALCVAISIIQHPTDDYQNKLKQKPKPKPHLDEDEDENDYKFMSDDDENEEG